MLHPSIRSGHALLLVAAVALSGCTNLGTYVWVKDYSDPRPPPTASTYVLGPGDLINVAVFGQDGMSARARVRSDGKISLPFLNDVQVEGFTPNDLATQLSVRLKDFVNKPVVTVSVEEQRQIKIAVVGEVARPGIIEVAPGTGLLQALAIAGGLNDLAGQDRIFVVRYQPVTTRVRFDYKELLRAMPPASSFQLRAGDQIVVE